MKLFLLSFYIKLKKKRRRIKVIHVWSFYCFEMAKVYLILLNKLLNNICSSELMIAALIPYFNY